MVTTKDILEHHGIKGMKWGVRRKRGAGGTVDSSGGSGHPKPHELSDEQLKSAISRLEMEHKYKTLLSDPQKKKMTGEGAKFAQDLGKTLVKNALTAVGTHVVSQALGVRAEKAAELRKKAKELAG